MSKSRLIFNLFAGALVYTVVASSAYAQGPNPRSFVSASNGNDANPCTRAAPCRTFQRGVSQAQAGGEVVVLDPGGFGPVVITLPVSIVAQGVYAGITNPNGGDGVTINTTGRVELRGLSINNVTNGITVNAVGSLYVVNCHITGASANGINFTPPGGGFAQVSDTVITACGGSGTVVSAGMGNSSVYWSKHEEDSECLLNAIRAVENATVHATDGRAFDCGTGYACQSSATRAQMNCDSCVAEECGTGYSCMQSGTGNSSMALDRCSASDCGTGFACSVSGTGNCSMTLGHCTAADNTTGIASMQSGGGMASVFLGYCTVTKNTTGVNVGAGTAVSGTNPGTSLFALNGADLGVFSNPSVLR